MKQKKTLVWYKNKEALKYERWYDGIQGGDLFRARDQCMEANSRTHNWSDLHSKECKKCDIGVDETVEHVTLECGRYLASGCSLTELHHTYKIGISTASEVVRRVCTQVWDKMKEECVPEPDEQEWYSIAAGFEKYANFPHCIGAIDGKLINSKKNGPLVLLVAVDTSHRFTSVQIIPYGTSSDSSIFYDSHLWRKLQENALNIPKPELLPGTDEQLPFVFVGDEAFVLSANILRPYSGRNLPDRKKIFNYRLSRARRYVECAFGILSNKWGIFHRPLNVNMDFAIGLVQACCVLHNFVLERDGVNFDDTLTITGLEDFEFGDPVQGGRIANKYRDTFSNYFISDVGQVKWQYTRI